MTPKTLNKQTIERIEQEAKKRFPITDTSTFSGIMQDAYFVGATAEATRHEQERKELVQQTNKMREALEDANKFIKSVDEYSTIPDKYVETYSNDYMNVTNQIDEALK